MTETGLLLEQLRVRTGGAVAYQMRRLDGAVDASDPETVLALLRNLGPAAAQWEPRAVAATTAFHRALELGVAREEALAFMLSGAVDAVTGTPGIFADDGTTYGLKSKMPGLLERFDTNTAQGRAEFDSLVDALFSQNTIASGRIAPDSDVTPTTGFTASR